MIESSTFTAVVGICSALFSPDYLVEDKIHKAQACQVFREYCLEPLPAPARPSDSPQTQYDNRPWFNYESRGSMRRKQRREP